MQDGLNMGYNERLDPLPLDLVLQRLEGTLLDGNGVEGGQHVLHVRRVQEQGEGQEAHGGVERSEKP